MNINGFDILPQQSQDAKEVRVSRDRHCYMAGREAAQMQLPRDNGVQYNDKRDLDCYNMGYSSVKGK